MHRRVLLDLLDDLVAFDAAEDRALAEILAFVVAEPRCFERSLAIGHVTGSAWIWSTDGEAVVLLHHGKLDRWLQPGGHADGDADIARVASREAREETGLTTLRLESPAVFDVDVHPIPTTATEAGHFHYDVRFLFRADRSELPQASGESRSVAWIALEDVCGFSDEESVRRMLAKTMKRR
jgi:ADP-ribose pyrophosphatase YjhB (NUDIX family)